MTRPDLERISRRAAQTAAIRGLRRKRNLSVADVATRMGLTIRTYERFEAGEGRADFDRLLRFAEVVDADVVALFCAILFGAPELAVRHADNKMMWVAAHSVERFNLTLGEGAARIETFDAISAFDVALRDLRREFEAKDRLAKGWMVADPTRLDPKAG